jgi:flagellar biosynthesis anti-sigma factor FlgM
MSMRIDGQRPSGVDAEAARRLESAKAAEKSTSRGPVSGTGDRVEVSADAQLVASALQAAHDASPIRPEAVERGRRALESGTLGRNADALADRMIDSLLGD